MTCLITREDKVLDGQTIEIFIGIASSLEEASIMIRRNKTDIGGDGIYNIKILQEV